MTFVLRIFFSGLIAFVPGSKGKDLTVLLVNAPHSYHVSDGTVMPEHKPLLLVRAGNCSGVCPVSSPAVAEYLFPGTPVSQATDSLVRALRDGGVWELEGSDLSLVDDADRVTLSPLEIVGNGTDSAASIPDTPAAREEFHWVADFNRIDPNSGGVNPELLSNNPPAGLIASRLRLHNGKVITYRLVQVAGKVRPIHFQSLAGNGSPIDYSQALASWVEAEIQVTGDNIEIVDDRLDGSEHRSMKLSPHNGVVEMAILNLPPSPEPVLPPYARNPEPGKHFEAYYNLARTPPAKGNRPVPRMDTVATRDDEPQLDWESLHPGERQRSELLEAIRFGVGRGPYDVILCPMIRY